MSAWRFPAGAVIVGCVLSLVATPALSQTWSSLSIPNHPTSGIRETMRSVHCVNALRCWAVGYNGAILATVDGGTTWTYQTSGITNRLLAVRFTDANNGWAGAGAVVLRTANGGATWINANADPSALKFRNSLFAVSATQAWAPVQCSSCMPATRWFSRYTVQGGGAVLEEDFNVVGSSAAFLDLYFVDVDNGWAVSNFGQITRISNASSVSPSFSPQTSGVATSLNGIFMLDATQGWIVGNGGVILKTTDGTNWSPLTSGTATNLKDVFFIDQHRGWVVGEGGVIRATGDGGATWSPQTSGVSTVLWSVDYTNAGLVAGGDLVTSGNGVVLATTQVSSGLVENGWFSRGLTNWVTFATPDSSYIVAGVTDGVLEFYRNPPPPNQSNQAVVLQNTGRPLGSGAALVATFDLGNSSTVRKRVSVLIHDGDFSDLSVCTFWLAPGSAVGTYTMRTHSTKAWSNASISFYAATAGSDGGHYQLDNVSVQYAAQPTDRTDCVDPTAPAPPGGADGPELLVNGSFSTGTTSGWTLFGQLTQQVAGGVFEFYRPSASPDPAGVILQPTASALATGEIVTAAFDLGNSSGVRKRVTVLLHDLDFSDLSACTFWLAPGQLPATYAMRSVATEAWSNLTISIYAATVGDDQWTRLDNVTLRKTPGSTPSGTDCVEPGGALPAAADLAGLLRSTASASNAPAGPREPAADPVARDARTAPRPAASTGLAPEAGLATSARAWLRAIDLREVAQARLQLLVYPSGDEALSVQVSLDGERWLTLVELSGTGDRISVDLDLASFVGHVVWVRVSPWSGLR